MQFIISEVILNSRSKKKWCILFNSFETEKETQQLDQDFDSSGVNFPGYVRQYIKITCHLITYLV